MEADLSGTRSTGTQPNSDGRSKRQRLEDDGSDQRQQTPPIENNSDDSVDLDESDSDGELTPLERASQKRKLKAAQKLAKENRDRDSMVGLLANSHQTPKAATALARALQEYVKMILGVYRKSRSPGSSSAEPTLPDPPTEDEVRAWATRQESREETIRKAMERALTKYLSKKPADFIPNRKQIRTVEKDAAEKAMLSAPLKPVKFTSRVSLTFGSRYNHRWGHQCEAALALAGFSRCTFDWNGKSDSAWNTAMLRIILQEWEKCHEAHGTKAFGILESENTPKNRIEIVQRWRKGQTTKFRDQEKLKVMSRTPEGKLQADRLREMSKSKDRRRRAKTKIHTARQELAQGIFGGASPKYLLLSHPEVHSEDKVVIVNGSGSRCKARLEWRSGALDTFVNLVDQLIEKQETIPRKKARAKAIVERGSYSSSDPDTFPPQKFQETLVSNAWLDKMSGIEVTNLKLVKAETVNIQTSIETLTNLLLPRGAAGLGAGPSSSGGSSSAHGPMMTQ